MTEIEGPGLLLGLFRFLLRLPRGNSNHIRPAGKVSTGEIFGLLSVYLGHCCCLPGRCE